MSLEVVDKLNGRSLLLLNSQTSIFIFLEGPEGHFAIQPLELVKEGLEKRVVKKRDAARFAFLFRAFPRPLILIAEKHVEKIDIVIGRGWRKAMFLADFDHVFEGKLEFCVSRT